MIEEKARKKKRRVVVVGGGFGGLACARKLARRDAIEVILIDRENHHLFQPLLYQVATSTLASPDIARSLRGLFAREGGVDVQCEEVCGIDPKEKLLRTESGRELSYDALVLATGARSSFFGNDHWAEHVHVLKSLADALAIRKSVLQKLERADLVAESEREALSSVVIVGGGPTGVELAGAFSDLLKRNMAKNYQRFDPRKQRIVLLEGMDRVLGGFDAAQSAYTEERLRSLGVEVRTGAMVKEISAGRVSLADGTCFHAGTIIWTAGVEANPLVRQLGVELGRGTRVPVENDLSVPGFPEVFVIGDAALVQQADGTPVPGVAPAAVQQGEFVADLLMTRDWRTQRSEAFEYQDKGNMAVVSKGGAVAQIGSWSGQGKLAWLLWLFVHVMVLVDFRSRLGVLLSWFWAYVRNVPGTRVFSREEGDAQLVTRSFNKPSQPSSMRSATSSKPS
ncbi:MAG: NAD(P)/FAD-dependent oxidoreductase [Verrucomicrobiales bacterium]